MKKWILFGWLVSVVAVYSMDENGSCFTFFDGCTPIVKNDAPPKSTTSSPYRHKDQMSTNSRAVGYAKPLPTSAPANKPTVRDFWSNIVERH